MGVWANKAALGVPPIHIKPSGVVLLAAWRLRRCSRVGLVLSEPRQLVLELRSSERKIMICACLFQKYIAVETPIYVLRRRRLVYSKGGEGRGVLHPTVGVL